MEHTYEISVQLTVAGLDLLPGPERDKRIATAMQIVRDGLAQCKDEGIVADYFVGRQMRPWNDKRDDGKPEPDILEEVTITGDNYEVVSVSYAQNPVHIAVRDTLRKMGVKWQIVVVEKEINSE